MSSRQLRPSGPIRGGRAWSVLVEEGPGGSRGSVEPNRADPGTRAILPPETAPRYLLEPLNWLIFASETGGAPTVSGSRGVTRKKGLAPARIERSLSLLAGRTARIRGGTQNGFVGSGKIQFAIDWVEEDGRWVSTSAIVVKRSFRREIQRYSSAGLEWVQTAPAASATTRGNVRGQAVRGGGQGNGKIGHDSSSLVLRIHWEDKPLIARRDHQPDKIFRNLGRLSILFSPIDAKLIPAGQIERFICSK